MKKIFILWVALMLPFSVIANEKVIERDGIFYDLETNKPYTGVFADKYIYAWEYKNYAGKGKGELKFQYRFNLKNGLRHGVSTLYYSSSDMNVDTGEYNYDTGSYKHTEATFENGKIIQMNNFNKDGTLVIIAIFDGKKAIATDQLTGKIVSEFEYISGSQVILSESGSMHGHTKLTGQALGFHGKRINYSKRRTTTKHYKNNVRHGKDISTFNSTGKPFIVSNTHNGKQDGDYKVYCENGKLKKHVTYLMGEIVQTFVDQNNSEFCYQ